VTPRSGPPRHVLVARLDNFGDVLLAGPAVRAVAGGTERVTMLTSPRGRAAAELLPGVDEVVVYDAPWISPEPVAVDRGSIERLVTSVMKLELDVGLILTSFHQSALPLALVLRMAGVPTIAAISDDYPGSLLDLRHHVPDHLHEVRRDLSLVEAAGFPLPVGDDASLRIVPVSAKLDLALDRYVVLHPGASVPARTWPADRFVETAHALATSGHPVLVTGGSSERPLADAVAASGDGTSGSVTSLAGDLSLDQLAAVIAGADAVVVGNTGPAHLAAAVGTPVVSLFPPTVPAERWRPWMVPHVLLGNQSIGCAGCRARACPFGGLQPCLAEVTADDVVAAVDHLTAGESGSDGRGSADAAAPQGAVR
jgi:ADP-heptose:LPS heptosyltransferase